MRMSLTKVVKTSPGKMQSPRRQIRMTASSFLLRVRRLAQNTVEPTYSLVGLRSETWLARANLRSTVMANNWNIPQWLEIEVRARDISCVYCSCRFLLPKKSAKRSASWEHIINDESVITRENIALCCRSCNASKGQKSVSEWLRSRYCIERAITPESVAPIIKAAIANGQ